MKYLGHIVSKDGIRLNPETVAPVKIWPIPTNITEMRKFLGLTGYFRQFVERYSVVPASLMELTKPSKVWNWSEDAAQAFFELKRMFRNAQTLRLSHMPKPFRVVIDACINGSGVVLLQEEHPVAYESTQLTHSNATIQPQHRRC